MYVSVINSLFSSLLQNQGVGIISVWLYETRKKDASGPGLLE